MPFTFSPKIIIGGCLCVVADSINFVKLCLKAPVIDKNSNRYFASYFLAYSLTLLEINSGLGFQKCLSLLGRVFLKLEFLSGSLAISFANGKCCSDR